jgi:hypothetical protein
MEGYRPAFDIELAAAETTDVQLVEADVSRDSASAAAAHLPAPVPLACVDPTLFPLPEPYSLDGITAIPADVFRRANVVR